MGLQRQVASNVIASAAITVRTMGALLVLWLVSATVEAFLAWQIVASLAETLVTAWVAWRSLPAVAPARFRKDLALGIWRFAAGVGAVTIFSVIVTQLDKVILSGLLPLTAFGYYMLATRVSGALGYLAGPIMASFFPRYSQLHESANEGELRRVYHQSCQLLSFLVLPPAVMLILFPYEILALWTQNMDIAENASVTLALLAAGTALNALATPPHMLQFASGWTRLALVYSATATIVLAPLIYFMTIRFGGVGAAAVWLLLNAANLLINVVFTHRRLLRGDMWIWIRSDFALPLGAAFAGALAWKWLAPAPAEWTLSLLNLVLASAVAFALVAAVTPEIRRLATRSLTRNYGF
jgi:O-antigen/teichoic acid export membrane protein